jgi:hypothetical protein
LVVSLDVSFESTLPISDIKLMFLFAESKRYNSYQQGEIEVEIQLQRSWARRRQEIQYIQLA